MYSPTRYTKFFIIEFYSSHMFSSTCFGPHRSIFRSDFYKLYVQIWYVVIRVLFDTSSRYEVTAYILLYLDLREQKYDDDSKQFKNKKLHNFFVFPKLLLGGGRNGRDA